MRNPVIFCAWLYPVITVLLGMTGTDRIKSEGLATWFTSLLVAVLILDGAIYCIIKAVSNAWDLP